MKKTTKKIRVAVLFGGKSAEHEVSLLSAKSVVENLDKNIYDVMLIGIDKQGRFLLNENSQYLLNAEDPKQISLQTSDVELSVIPGQQSGQLTSQKKSIGAVDVVIPMLHGPYGEDGSMQGLLTLMNVPFVGADVLGSAVSMDKDVMKRLLRDAGIAIANFVVARKGEKISFQKIKKVLGLPLFVKPANLGSSVGVSKVDNEKEFARAVADAFSYDTKIIIEDAIVGDELYVSVLGNDNPLASVPGKLITDHQFYDYDAKYIDEIQMEIPAKVTKRMTKLLQETAINAYKALCCSGMARVDMFLTKEGKIYLCEINTIPGFTSHSWYPKLWEASGIEFTKLLDKLIRLAIERHDDKQLLKTSRA